MGDQMDDVALGFRTLAHSATTTSLLPGDKYGGPALD